MAGFGNPTAAACEPANPHRGCGLGSCGLGFCEGQKNATPTPTPAYPTRNPRGFENPW